MGESWGVLRTASKDSHTKFFRVGEVSEKDRYILRKFLKIILTYYDTIYGLLPISLPNPPSLMKYVGRT